MKNSEPFFRSGKWCKDKSNILNHQIFQELFRKLFSKSLFEPASVGTFATFVSRLRRTVFVIADAKVGIISKRANIFELFLSFFSKKTAFRPYIPFIYKTGRRHSTPPYPAAADAGASLSRRSPEKYVSPAQEKSVCEDEKVSSDVRTPPKSLRTKSYTARERQEKMRQKGHFTEKNLFWPAVSLLPCA